MSQRRDADALRTAYHEAGHAVVSWYTGFGVDHVTVTPGDGWAGRSIWDADYAVSFDERRIMGVWFFPHPEQGLLVEDPVDSAIYRQPTGAEREIARVDDLLTLTLDRGNVERLLMAATAGEAAQLIATATTLDADALEVSHERGDRYVFALADPSASWDEWTDHTKTFLRDATVWRGVEAIAAALLKRRTLTGDDVTEILRTIE
jgi:hypothetical protein